MSSLAAAQADSFYFPPEYDGRKHGGLSKFNNPNYKGSNQWQQAGIVRMELPFDGWCLGCKRHISKGHRFNAKKEDAGKYFSTKIFSFHMKCPNTSCSQKFVIKTDPKNSTYDYAEGIRKMEQDYDVEDEDRVIKLASDETKEKLATDAMFKLEYDNDKRMKAESAKEQIGSLIDLNEKVIKRDYDINSELRRRNRKLKKQEKSMLTLGNSIGLSVPLLECEESDRIGALEAKFKPRYDGTFGASERSSMMAIREQSIFTNKNKSSSSSGEKRKKTSSSSLSSTGNNNSLFGKEESALQKQARLMIKVGVHNATTKTEKDIGALFNVNNTKGKRQKTMECQTGHEDKFNSTVSDNGNSNDGNGLSLLSTMYEDVSD